MVKFDSKAAADSDLSVYTYRKINLGGKEMDKVDLIRLLRNDFNNYIREIYIKDNCEVCYSTIDLHLHHKIAFKNQFNYSLELLSMKNKENFNDLDVELIRNVMIGLQIRDSNYMTLCKECHIKKHSLNGCCSLEEIYNNYLNGLNTLKINPHDLNKWITKEELYNIMKTFNIKNNNSKLIGLRSFKAILNNSGYKLKSKRKVLNKTKSTYYYITNKGDN